MCPNDALNADVLEKQIAVSMRCFFTEIVVQISMSNGTCSPVRTSRMGISDV